ncbi:MAG: hypothetical protein KKB74_12310 [Bacteroidetes bacterium]|nr:hypothetical protein [Bacteroidota bacterium]
MKRIYLLISLVLFTSLKIVFSQTCLPDGITFGLQQEIDEFTTNYPNCTEIEGNVTITGGWDLDSLYKITRIGEFLRILDNDDLTSLHGLDNIDHNTIGQRVFYSENILNNIDISMLGKGIYVAEIVTRNLNPGQKKSHPLKGSFFC